MFSAIYNYVSKVRQRLTDPKSARSNLSFSRIIDDAQNERKRLWESPPPCGSVIRYVPMRIYEETNGEFLLQTADVELELQERLQLNPRLASGDEGAILRWVQEHDEAVTELTDVPPIWYQLQYVANDLVRAGKADIFCQKC